MAVVPGPLENTFPWPTLKAIVSGDSALDVPTLEVTSVSDAEAFLESYGFLWIASSHRVELETIRMEAWDLLEQELLIDEPTLIPPPGLRAELDTRKLLLLASHRPRNDEQRWACALLRVMHVMAHAHSGLNERYGPEVRVQVLDRFEPHLHNTPAGLQLGRGHLAVPLAHFEVKHGKPLRSVTMKLLHKKENVSAGVFDHLGLRFVTHHRFDALLVIRYLRMNNLIMFANVAPNRSRNSLLDLEALRDGMRALDDQLEAGNLELARANAELRNWVEDLPFPGSASEYNPHSASEYHSIQVTCRRLVRIPSLNAGELRFFFPYEIQIMDAPSWEQTRSGRASHSDYKGRQRATVKRRVLRELLARR